MGIETFKGLKMKIAILNECKQPQSIEAGGIWQLDFDDGDVKVFQSLLKCLDYVNTHDIQLITTEGN